jgi:hypothetical protein
MKSILGREFAWGWGGVNRQLNEKKHFRDVVHSQLIHANIY